MKRICSGQKLLAPLFLPLLMLVPHAARASMFGEENIQLFGILRTLISIETTLLTRLQELAVAVERTRVATATVARYAPAPSQRVRDGHVGLRAQSETFGGLAPTLLHEPGRTAVDGGRLRRDHDALLAQLVRQRHYAQASGRGLLRQLQGAGLTPLEAQVYQARSGALGAAANVESAAALEAIRFDGLELRASKRRAAAAAAAEWAADVGNMQVWPAPVAGRVGAYRAVSRRAATGGQGVRHAAP